MPSRLFKDIIAIKTFLLFLVVALSCMHVSGQSSTKKSRIILIKNDQNYRYEYEALRSDTSIKDGYFQFFYKSKLIEKGNYSNNKKVGLWRYYNLKGIFEFEYDFTARKVTKLSGDRDPELETPCLFNGSPIIPYLFIVQHIRYPKEAVDKDLSGKVILGLKINKEGTVWAMYLVEKFHPLFDSEVMRVARDFPADWEWIPATKFRSPVDGEYLITVEFELY